MRKQLNDALQEVRCIIFCLFVRSDHFKDKMFSFPAKESDRWTRPFSTSLRKDSLRQKQRAGSDESMLKIILFIFCLRLWPSNHNKPSGGEGKGAGPERRSGHTNDGSPGERASVHHLLRTLHRGELSRQIHLKQEPFKWRMCFCRRSPWTAPTASAPTASTSGAKRRRSVPSADRPSRPKAAAWLWTTSSSAWWRTWAWTSRRRDKASSTRGKVRGAFGMLVWTGTISSVHIEALKDTFVCFLQVSRSVKAESNQVRG